MTTYIGYAHIVCSNKVAGNQIASLVDPDDGSNTFNDKARVTKDGETYWTAETPLTQSGLDLFTEFSGDGPYTKLNAIGISDGQIAVLKSMITMVFGPREEYERVGVQFLADNGFTRV